MRVLHIGAGNLYGGVERLLVTLAWCREMAPEMDPEFALCFDGRLRRELDDAGATVHLIDPVRASRPWTVARGRRAVAEVLRRRHIDVAVCHSSWPHAVFGPAVRSAGVPLAVWRHGAGSASHWVDRWARRLPPDLVICNSRYTRETLSSDLDRIRTEVLYNPVAAPDRHHCAPLPDDLHRPGPPQPAARQAVRAELRTPLDAVVITQLGRLEPWKGHAVHLAALGALAQMPGWVLWQVGGPQRRSEATYLQRLQRQADVLGIAARVRFTGERSDVSRLLAASDIYCQPNVEPEPFGIACVEALHAGLPLVAAAVGGPREIIDPDCGVLIPAGDEAVLARVLKRLIQDHDLRARLGAAGPARARALCDPATQMARLRDLLCGIQDGALRP